MTSRYHVSDDFWLGECENCNNDANNEIYHEKRLNKYAEFRGANNFQVTQIQK